MKTKSFYICTAGAAALLLLGAGCKSKGDTGLTHIPQPEVITKERIVRVPVPTPGPGTGLPPGNTGPGSRNPTGTDLNPYQWPPGPTDGLAIPYDFKRDVFGRVQFDYDSSELRSGDLQLVEQVALTLQQNPTHLLLVEGHCDERGTEDYNLSLGERRAIAVVEELLRLGVAQNRLRSQSYGEKVKVDEADTTAAHAKNRRGEFVLVVPKPQAAPPAPERINLGPAKQP